MRAVVWSNDALRDFDQAIAHIAYEDFRNATLVADRIEAAVGLLAETPIGHPGRVVGTYEKLALNTPYIIAYALSDQTLTILRIIHSSRDWLANEWPKDG